MNTPIRELGFYFKRMASFASLLALLFLPLSFIVSSWIGNLSHNVKVNSCDAENRTVHDQLITYTEQLKMWATTEHENSFSTFADEILVTISYQIKNKNLQPQALHFNKNLIAELRLSPASLMQSLQPARNELQKSLHEPMAIQATQTRDLPVWSFNFRLSPTDSIMVTTYPRRFLKHIEKFKCGMVLFNSAGQILYKKTETLIDESELYNFALQNPLSSENEALYMNVDTNLESQIRLAVGNTLIATIADTSTAKGITRNVFILFLAMGGFTFLIGLIILSRYWFIEFQTSKLMTATIKSFVNGNFSARPRLFLTNHFSMLEHYFDKLGFFLSELKVLGSSLVKSGLTPVQLREYSKKAQNREVVVLSLYLPPLDVHTSNGEDALSLYNEVADVFSKVTRKNSGAVDFATPQHFQSVWNLVEESQFDTANAAMTALELKVAFSNINTRLILGNKKPIPYGVGIHRSYSQVSIMGSEHVRALSALGDANYESLFLAQQSSQTNTEILISEIIATLIEPYFILGDSKETTSKKLKTYTIEGYVDNQENPILIRSKKFN